MIGEIKEVFSLLIELYRSNMDKEYKKFNEHITDVFERARNIEEDYINILSDVNYGVIYENWSGNTTVKYLTKVENELKSERVYIREELKHINKVYNGDLEVFVGAVLNIMYCEYVDRFKHGKDIEHRFTGLIELARQFKYDPLYLEQFIGSVDYMMYDVNRSWETLCAEYFRLKEKYNDKF